MKEFQYKGWICWSEAYSWYAQKNNDFINEISSDTRDELLFKIDELEKNHLNADK